MKKFLPILLLAFASLFIYSCDNRDNNNNFVDNDTVGTAFDITATLGRVDDNLYQYTDTFTTPLVRADVVLIYLQTDVTNNGSPVWNLLPYTFYTDNNVAVGYSFNFSRFDIRISLDSTLNLTPNTNFYTNKRFRVVILPANLGNAAGKGAKAATPPVDYNDYNSVIKYYNIDESKIKTKN
ncbi:hypothetical protein IQ37_18650 [Chryseobacterium piperi]|uniref:Lipoprotein n=1 Tax=Chryseobacterium piperi TaxID=558152 RepID=A0A086AFB7_9FLAO|nr:hypothetical protein [Chryseobacterium piperi]ASW74871.1 hypothetical protein CJF12_11650 [Chryseobacterium piperi]KFF15381.1 hypothetical protein IQ37_18650 [Chryseobacterium piperi]